MTTSNFGMKVILLSSLLTAVLSMLIIYETWEWFTPWGDLNKHLPVLYSALKGLLLGDSKSLMKYVAYLQQSGYKVDFILHLSLPVIVSAVASVNFSFKIFSDADEGDKGTHVSGPILLKDKEAFRHAKKSNRDEIVDDVMGKGLFLHPEVQISKLRELGNIFVFGQQGSGKSVIVKPIIKESIDRGAHVLIYDQKREYTVLFHDKNTILISPTDQRGVPWNISADITNVQQASLLAECFIPENGDEFWEKGARLIFSACLIYLIKTKESWGWSDIQQTMGFSESKLKAIFTIYYPAAAKLIEEQSKTTQGFLTILVTRLSWLEDLATAWPDCENGFSISNWVDESTSKKVMIIPSDPLYPNLSGSLCSAVFSLASQYALSLEDSDTRRILFAVDELGNLPRSDSIEKWLSLGRSKGICTIAGTQSISQLHDIYGEEKTETILSLFSNVICLRLGSSGRSSQKASESFGNKTVKLPVISIDPFGNKSTTWQLTDKAVVQAESITHLPQASKKGVQGFLCVNGWNAVYKLVWPFPIINKIAKEYEPAPWLKAEKKVKVEVQRGKRGSRGRNK